MKKRFKNILVLVNVITCYLLPIVYLHSSALNFVKMSVGARPTSMGETFCGIADTAESISWNIAGLGNIETREFSATHLEFLEGIKYDSLVYTFPTKYGNFGILAGYLYLYDIPKTIISSDEIFGYKNVGTYSAEDRTVALGYGKYIKDNTSFGILLRWSQERLESYVSSDVISFDLGILHYINEKISIGASIQNFGTTIKFVKKQEIIPTVLRIGVGYKSTSFISGCDIVFDVPNQKVELHTGLEYEIMKIFYVRCGYRIREENIDFGYFSGATGGFGFKVYNYQINYCIVPYGDFGFTHRITFGGKF